jgi:hypothetical protein
MPIDVELRIEPNAGETAFAVSDVAGTEGAPSLAVDVAVGGCTDANAEYTIEQQVGDNWVSIGAPISVDGTVTITQDFSGATPVPLVYGNAYTYRLREHITGAQTAEEFVRTAFTADGDAQFTQALLFAPTTPPTLTPVSGTEITVQWAAVPKATQYVVQRALVTAGVPEPFVDVTTIDVPLDAPGPFTYPSTGLDPATTYQFRIIAANAGGSSLPGPKAEAATP